jgi:tetratricopeptide (TPR) repeat protein
MLRNLFLFGLSVLIAQVLPIHANETGISSVTDETNQIFQQADALYQHGRGKPEDFKEALRLFTIAAEQGHPKAQFYVGRMYHLGHATRKNGPKAEFWYLKAGNNGNATAWNNLANIYMGRSGVPYNPKKVIECYQKSVDLGNGMAASNLGYIYQYGRHGQKADLDKAIDYYEKAAKLGYTDAAFTLFMLTFHEEIIQRYGAERTQKWISNTEAIREQSTQAAKDAIAQAMPDIKEERYEAAIQIIDQAYRALGHSTTSDYYSRFEGVVWNEAQLRSGLLNSEWGIQLYQWIISKRDLRMPRSVFRIHTRGNLAANYQSAGKMTQWRELMEEICALIKELEGVDVDAEFNKARFTDEYQVSHQNFLLRHTAATKARARSSVKPGTLISAMSMSALLRYANESFLSGDWERSFFITQWAHAWAQEALESGEETHHNFPGGIESVNNNSQVYQAYYYEVLGLPESSIPIYQKLINSDLESYQGRVKDRAIAHLALLEAQLNLDASRDVDDLIKLEAKQASNQYAQSTDPQGTQLARAYVLYRQGEVDEAFALMDALIEETREQEGQSALKVLKVGSELALLDNRTEGVEAQLIRALKIARTKGLKCQEPRLYELYAKCLWQLGRYEEAIDIQKQAIDLMRSLRMKFRIDPALQTLALIEADAAQRNSALVAAINAPNPTLDSSTEAAINVPKQTLDSSTETETNMSDSISAQHGKFDIQPKRLVSAPLQGEDSYATFTLSNLSANEQSAELTIFGANKIEYVTNPSSELELSIIASGDSYSSTLRFKMEAMEQKLLRVHTPISLFSASDLALQLSTDQSLSSDDSELIIHYETGYSSSAVIDAAEIIDNPFYLVPVFHYLAQDPSRPTQAVLLRVVATRPTRVEVYDEAGQLLFIDANGNGRFVDSGDMLLTEKMRNGYPLVTLGERNQRIEFRYQSLDGDDAELEIQIQRATESNSNTWTTDAVDIIK